MAIKRICDKCHVVTKRALFRIKLEIVEGTYDPFDDGVPLTSTLDLCDGCAKKILKEANTENPL